MDGATHNVVTSVRPDATSLERQEMTCKIERVLTAVGFVVFRVSGRIDGAHVNVLQELMENKKTSNGRLAIDLAEVTLVSQEAVDALAVAEADGIELRDCPAYVREWLSRANDKS